jgi:nucleotide-binding universal stress UspA family protein
MAEIHRIIVGYDFREAGEIALLSAMTLARHSNATLKLVHVVEPYPLYQRVAQPLTSPYPLEERVQKAGAELEHRLEHDDLASVRTEFEVRTGKPFVELILAGRAWRTDLLIVGGVIPGNERLLGSTGLRLVRKAAFPVLIAKQVVTSGTKTFLVPTDFSSASREAAEVALLLARQQHGKVRFLHVIEIPRFYGVDMPLPQPITPDALDDEWEAFVADLPAKDDVPWEIHATVGRAAAEIVREAATSQADAIVLGTHGVTRLAYMLIGSVAEEVVSAAPCSVVTVRPAAFQAQLL